MIISRREYKQMELRLEILQDLYECYKIDRELFRWDHERLRIVESLLTEEQRFEYYRLMAEHEVEEAIV